MTNKIKRRIVRKVRRQYNYIGNRSSYLTFDYNDVDHRWYGWVDWSLD